MLLYYQHVKCVETALFFKMSQIIFFSNYLQTTFHSKLIIDLFTADSKHAEQLHKLKIHHQYCRDVSYTKSRIIT